MKTHKKLLGALGFAMLFFVPVNGCGILAYCLVWLPIALALLAYASSGKPTIKTSQQ